MRRSLPSSGTLSVLRRAFFVSALSLPIALAGCAAPTDDDDFSEESAADESALTGHVYDAGVTLRVTANVLNVRSGGGTSHRVVAQISRDVRVTVVQRSGGSGWVNIRTPNGTQGWAAGSYLTPAGASGSTSTGGDDVPDTSTATGGTCAAARGRGIVNRYQKALHDTLAHAEGTRGRSKDGYDILFGGTSISSCARHPNRCIKFGKSCSTATGRYQFLYRTWNSIANVRGYATFEPENQERGAAYLISSVRKASVPSNRPLSSSEFSNVITKLSYEWASLPPGQYGQPNKSMSELRSVYCSIAGC